MGNILLTAQGSVVDEDELQRFLDDAREDLHDFYSCLCAIENHLQHLVDLLP